MKEDDKTREAVEPGLDRGVGRIEPEREAMAGDYRAATCRGQRQAQRPPSPDALECGAQLVPCHWCGTDGADLFDLWDRFDAGHIAHVHCTHCGANGPSVYSETSANDAIKQARRRWNWPRPRNKTPNVRANLDPTARGPHE